jgi:hypothetical protein
MRLLILLIALAIVGVLVARQLTGPADSPARFAEDAAAVPDVPTRPQELDDFEGDMNRFIRESVEARRDAIDEDMR